MTIGTTIAYIIICIGPLYLKNIDFLIPSTIPFTNSKSFKGYALNYIFETFVVLQLMILCFSLILLLLVSVAHLWIEMKTIHSIALSLGEYEERERLKELNEEEEEDVETIEVEEKLTDSTELMKIITCIHIEVIE